MNVPDGGTPAETIAAVTAADTAPPHTCHATGCDVRVPRQMFMCLRHWFALPKRYQDAIWAEYVPGQERTKDPSLEYLEAAQAAIRYLEAK